MVNQLVKTDQVELLPDEVRKYIDPQGHGTDQEHQFFLVIFLPLIQQLLVHCGEMELI